MAKTLRCAQCQKKFSSHSLLDGHVKSVHQMTARFTFNGIDTEFLRDKTTGLFHCLCSLPDNAFASSKDLRRHCVAEHSSSGSGSNIVVDNTVAPIVNEVSYNTNELPSPPPPSSPDLKPFDVDVCASDAEPMVTDVDDCPSPPPSLTLFDDSLNVDTPSQMLARLGIRVDDRHVVVCLECQSSLAVSNTHSHLRSYHQARYMTKLPARKVIDNLLQKEGAFNAFIMPDSPIAPIEGLQVETDGYACTAHTSHLAFNSSRSLQRHFHEVHPDDGKTRKTHARSACVQVVESFPKGQKVVEVFVKEEACLKMDRVSIFLESLALLDNKNQTYRRQQNTRESSTFAFATQWDKLLEGLQPQPVIDAARLPAVQTEPLLHRLGAAVKKYVYDNARLLETLPTLVLRHLKSQDASDLKNEPFRRPQLDESMDKNASMFNMFLSFIIRTHYSPIPGFPVDLSQRQTQAVVDIHIALEQKASDDQLAGLVHSLAFLLLSERSPGTLRDQWLCPLIRFLVAAHLLDDQGNFLNPTRIPPNISKLQWVFRSTAARYIHDNKEEYDGDTFRVYETVIQPILKVGRPCLFNTLREHMTLISSLAYKEPGIPRFLWSVDYRVVSYDGFPLSLDKLVTGIHGTIKQAEDAFERVLRGCPLEDFWEVVDAALDFQRNDRWFTDKSREDSTGYSFVTDPANGLLKYREILLKHLLEGCGDDFVSDLPARNQYIKHGAVWEWLTDLSEVMKPLFVAAVSTWGGGARGTECDHFKWANHRGQRHLYMLNGLVTIVTNYVKTQQNTGSGKLIARALPPRVGRLFILLTAIVLPTACGLAAKVLPSEDALNYNSYLFVRYGKVMDSLAFSKALSSVTEAHLDISLGLRDWRQLMKSVLKHIVHVAIEDDEDEPQAGASVQHEMFGHSRITGEDVYGIEHNNSLAHLSDSAITRQQEYSLRYHVKLRLSTFSFEREDSKSDIKPMSIINPSIFSDEITQTVFKRVQSSIEHTFIPAVQSIVLQTLSNHFGPAPLTTPRHAQPPIVVHPSRLDVLRRLHPHVPDIQFTSPEQAELLELSMSQFHVFGILPTGGGKSIAIFGPALISPASLIVVITPFIALTDDLDRRLSGTQIPGGKWRNLEDPHTARIVLVSAHEAGQEDFIAWLKAVKSRLLRIVIDEAHHILLSDHYRPCFTFFGLMTQLGIPFTFLSATLMPHSVNAICEAMHIPLSLVREVRASSCRPNIQLGVDKVDEEALFDVLEERFRSITLQEQERGLIFCTTRDDCKVLADRLNVPYYIGPMHDDPAKNNDIKAQLDLDWRSGDTPWMVCTMCFGQGVDQSHVRHVMHAEVRSLTNFWQEVGRAGRDGHVSYSHVFYSRLPSLAGIDEHDHGGVAAMRKYLDSQQCRRLLLGVFDRTEAHSCAAIPNAQLCDFCARYQDRDAVVYHPNIPSVPAVDLCPPSNGSFVSKPVQRARVLPLVETVASHGAIQEAQHSERYKQLTELMTLLEHVKRFCVVCWFRGDFSKPLHTRTACTNALPRMDQVYFRSFSLTIKFEPNLLCYGCLVPHERPCNHPRPYGHGKTVDTTKCLYDDIIKPLACLIWTHKPTLSLVLQVLGVNPSAVQTVTQFARWSSQSPSLHALPNIFNLLLVYNRQRQEYITTRLKT